MAKHEINIHENTGATKSAAPYVGSYVSKETVKLADFVGAVALKCGLPAVQVQAIIAGAFDAIETLEAESLVRINLDGFAVQGVITGSFPTSDAAFDRARNALELALRLDDDLRNALANATPAILSDVRLTKLRVDNAMDLENERPYNLLHGQGVFRVAGFNMALDDEGAAAYLQDGKGTIFDLVVDEVVSKQLFKAHTAELLEGGDYKLVVKSRAGQADGPLQTAFRKVKYLKVAAPTPPVTPTVTNVHSASAAQDFSYVVGEDVEITGTGLALGAGDKVVIEFEEPSGEKRSWDASVTSASDTKIVCDGSVGFGEIPVNMYITVTVKGVTSSVMSAE